MARVLIIENDIATANEIAAELTAQQHTVEVAHDGADGLAPASTTDFDAICSNL